MLDNFLHEFFFDSCDNSKGLADQSEHSHITNAQACLSMKKHMFINLSDKISFYRHVIPVQYLEPNLPIQQILL